MKRGIMIGSKKIKMMVALVLCVTALSGCADLKNKFIRKKEEPQLARYVPVREYDVRPSMELYTKRYIYWKNWHREVMDFLDDPRATNQKKITVALEQEISNLLSMRNMLVDEKSDELQGLIDKVAEVDNTVKTETVTSGNRARITREMMLLGVQIKDGFSYRKMAGEIRDEFRTD
jgi:hypothetical protein